MKNESHTIIFFDGICTLCNGWVDFISARPAFEASKLKFASLQGKTAQEIFGKAGREVSMKSIVLYRNGNFYEESNAILSILAQLGFPWSLFYGFKIIPSFLRDAVYRVIAKNRYRWFGEKDSCRLPTSKERAWFLD